MRAIRIATLAGWSGMLASGVCLSLVASTDARAENSPLDLYAGAGAGYAKTDEYFTTAAGPCCFRSNQTGWKLLLGIRPLSWLGSELEYMDAGGAHAGGWGPDVTGSQFYGADAHVRGASLFAVGYLPLPERISWMDVFGKVGVSHTWVSASYAGNFPNTYINCTTTCVPVGQVSISETTQTTGPAFGGGIQFNFSQVSARLDFEAVPWKQSGNPYLASFVLTWKLEPR